MGFFLDRIHLEPWTEFLTSAIQQIHIFESLKLESGWMDGSTVKSTWHQAFRKHPASLKKHQAGAAGQAPSGPAALTFQEAVLWARRFREKMFTSYRASTGVCHRSLMPLIRMFLPTTGRQEMTRKQEMSISVMKMMCWSMNVKD